MLSAEDKKEITAIAVQIAENMILKATGISGLAQNGVTPDKKTSVDPIADEVAAKLYAIISDVPESSQLETYRQFSTALSNLWASQYERTVNIIESSQSEIRRIEERLNYINR